MNGEELFNESLEFQYKLLKSLNPVSHSEKATWIAMFVNYYFSKHKLIITTDGLKNEETVNNHIATLDDVLASVMIDARWIRNYITHPSDNNIIKLYGIRYRIYSIRDFLYKKFFI